MSNKVLLKIGVALGLLAVLLIFLGVNFAPRISAQPPAKADIVNAAKSAGPVTNQSQPSTINYSGSDYIERHPSQYYAGSDYFERHPAALDQPANTGSSYRWPFRVGHDFGVSPDPNPASIDGSHSYRPPYQIGHDFGVP